MAPCWLEFFSSACCTAATIIFFQTASLKVNQRPCLRSSHTIFVLNVRGSLVVSPQLFLAVSVAVVNSVAFGARLEFHICCSTLATARGPCTEAKSAEYAWVELLRSFQPGKLHNISCRVSSVFTLKCFLVIFDSVETFAFSNDSDHVASPNWRSSGRTRCGTTSASRANAPRSFLSPEPLAVKDGRLRVPCIIQS